MEGVLSIYYVAPRFNDIVLPTGRRFKYKEFQINKGAVTTAVPAGQERYGLPDFQQAISDFIYPKLSPNEVQESTKDHNIIVEKDNVDTKKRKKKRRAKRSRTKGKNKRGRKEEHEFKVRRHVSQCAQSVSTLDRTQYRYRWAPDGVAHG